MKITCVIGSARNNGSTAYLIDKFIEGTDGKAKICRHCIGDKNIKFCRGCKMCYTNGECVQSDDVKQVVEDILSSDLVVIAAPSYWADVPGQLKTFFDRCTPYGNTNPAIKLKADKQISGIAVAVRAGVRESENELILNSIEHYFGHMGIKTFRRISFCKTDSLNDLLQFHKNEIEEMVLLGKQVVQDV